MSLSEGPLQVLNPLPFARTSRDLPLLQRSMSAPMLRGGTCRCHSPAPPSLASPSRSPPSPQCLLHGQPDLQVTCHIARVTCHIARVTCHIARVTCHIARVTCHTILALTCT